MKDKQIEELNARLSECSAALVAAQQTAQAAQALHAGTIRQQITDGEMGKDIHRGEVEISKKKRNWFKRFLKFDTVKERDCYAEKRDDSDWCFTGSCIVYAGDFAFKSKYYPP